ncbi:carboxypeptidase regulatory-like domain-containing protein [Candidatus Woesearchaeota archaeon]|nr:carboxypeptidase regulatory-like domain-containing protein [Candidatus Woesearchaeota archaeon]
MRSETIIAVVLIVSILIIGTSLLTVYVVETKPAQHNEVVIVQRYSQPATFVIEKKNPEMELLVQKIESLERSFNQRSTEYYTQRYIEHYSGYTYRDEEYDLEITVKDDDSGGRIKDARVHIEDGESKTRHTDDDGEVTFYNLEEDCYEIEVTADNYHADYKRVCLDDDDEITIMMERK